MVIDLRVEVAHHDIFLVVPIVCACPTAWSIGNLHQTSAVEEEPCPSAVDNKPLGAVELVVEEAFDRFRRLISVEDTKETKKMGDNQETHGTTWGDPPPCFRFCEIL